MAKPKAPSIEKETQKAAIEWLTLKRIFHWRNNSGAARTMGGGFMRFGAVGSPDIFAIKDGKIYGLEVKDTKGRLSDGQKKFEADMNAAGGIYTVVRSIDDVLTLFP